MENWVSRANLSVSEQGNAPVDSWGSLAKGGLAVCCLQTTRFLGRQSTSSLNVRSQVEIHEKSCSHKTQKSNRVTGLCVFYICFIVVNLWPKEWANLLCTLLCYQVVSSACLDSQAKGKGIIWSLWTNPGRLTTAKLTWAIGNMEVRGWKDDWQITIFNTETLLQALRLVVPKQTRLVDLETVSCILFFI